MLYCLRHSCLNFPVWIYCTICHIGHVLNCMHVMWILKIRQSDWSFPISENEDQDSPRPRNLKQVARPSLVLAEEGVVWGRDYTTPDLTWPTSITCSFMVVLLWLLVVAQIVNVCIWTWLHFVYMSVCAGFLVYTAYESNYISYLTESGIDLLIVSAYYSDIVGSCLAISYRLFWCHLVYMICWLELNWADHALFL